MEFQHDSKVTFPHFRRVTNMDKQQIHKRHNGHNSLLGRIGDLNMS